MVKFSVYLDDNTKDKLDAVLSHIQNNKGKTIARGKAIGIIMNHLTPTYIHDVLRSYGYQIVEAQHEDQGQTVQV